MFFCGTGGEEGRRMVTSETEAQAVLGRRCSEEKTVGGGPGKPSTSRLNSYNTVFRSGHLWESRTRVCLCVSIFERPFFCSINIDDHRLIQVGNWTEKANCAQYLSTPAVFFFLTGVLSLFFHLGNTWCHSLQVLDIEPCPLVTRHTSRIISFQV